MVASHIVTQIPKELRDKLKEFDIFTDTFKDELRIVEEEAEYRKQVIELLRHYYKSLANGDIVAFFQTEVKKRQWHLFNYLFIRKAVDLALDQGANEREACSQLLVTCTHELHFGNHDFGYAFDSLVWNHE